MNLFKGFSFFIICFSLFFVGMRRTEARDLSGRIGLGFNNEFSNSTWNRPVPALSLKYGFTKDTAVAGMFALNTQLPMAMTVGGKFFKNLFYENNLNFYTALAFAYLKLVDPAVEFLALIGAEFFIPGIESLGFSFEAGASANNTTRTFEIKTVGFTFLHAGMHFYF